MVENNDCHFIPSNLCQFLIKVEILILEFIVGYLLELLKF